MDLFTKANGLDTQEKDMGYRPGPMELPTPASGSRTLGEAVKRKNHRTKHRGWANSSMLLETGMKGSTWMTCSMAMELQCMSRPWKLLVTWSQLPIFFNEVDGSKYTGNFWCDKHHGDGVEVWPDGKRFQGTYHQGMKHGQGTFRWPDGSKYTGNFEANNLTGLGSYAWADGRTYTGEWEKNTMHGKGTFSYGDGRTYTGDFFEDVKHGHGVFTWPDGRKYDGEWRNGQRHGKGRYTYANHRTKSASFEDGVFAMRRAWSETHRPEVKSWLEQKIGLATFDRSYYYTVDTKQKMFYAAISAELEALESKTQTIEVIHGKLIHLKQFLEAARLRDAGFENVRVQICNIINFFDIQTKPKAARINAAVIRLLERGDVWRAQLLLSRGVALAFNKPLSSLRIGSCIFDNSSEHALYGQVARYFISTGESAR
eukprot:symbB.v1.2.002396.t2/scaffold125.1/size314497/12